MKAKVGVKAQCGIVVKDLGYELADLGSNLCSATIFPG